MCPLGHSGSRYEKEGRETVYKYAECDNVLRSEMAVMSDVEMS